MVEHVMENRHAAGSIAPSCSISARSWWRASPPTLCADPKVITALPLGIVMLSAHEVTTAYQGLVAISSVLDRGSRRAKIVCVAGRQWARENRRC